MFASENGDLKEALDYYEEALLIRKKHFGDEHVDIAQVNQVKQLILSKYQTNIHLSKIFFFIKFIGVEQYW